MLFMKRIINFVTEKNCGLLKYFNFSKIVPVLKCILTIITLIDTGFAKHTLENV